MIIDHGPDCFLAVPHSFPTANLAARARIQADGTGWYRRATRADHGREPVLLRPGWGEDVEGVQYCGPVLGGPLLDYAPAG